MSRDPVAESLPQRDARMALAWEWRELVEKVRELEGFESFLRPFPYRHLQAAAVDGPVVVVNVSHLRCDALIIHCNDTLALPLPFLDLNTTLAMTNDYLDVLEEAERALDAYVAAHQAGPHATLKERQAVVRTARFFIEAQQRAENVLRTVLAWLWDTIAEPVLDKLNFTKTPVDGEWPRVWWCPTGPLTLLPLHAAGYHGSTEKVDDRNVLDRVISSYTPTLRALIEARKPLESSGDEQFLVVAAGNVSGQVPLTGLHRELETLTGQLQGLRVTVLEGVEATPERVREELACHRWVHFSCHGDQNLERPSEGGLILNEDRILTISDVSADSYRGDFAGLSACKTATGGVRLMDEVITLAAALHHTGYRHVIATLWSVDEVGAADLFGYVYRNLLSNGYLATERCAMVLHQATRTLRHINRDRPSAWSPFTHTGP